MKRWYRLKFAVVMVFATACSSSVSARESEMGRNGLIVNAVLAYVTRAEPERIAKWHLAWFTSPLRAPEVKQIPSFGPYGAREDVCDRSNTRFRPRCSKSVRCNASFVHKCPFVGFLIHVSLLWYFYRMYRYSWIFVRASQNKQLAFLKRDAISRCGSTHR